MPSPEYVELLTESGRVIVCLPSNLSIGDKFRMPNSVQVNLAIDRNVRWMFGKSIVNSGLQGVHYLVSGSFGRMDPYIEIAFITINNE